MILSLPMPHPCHTYQWTNKPMTVYAGDLFRSMDKKITSQAKPSFADIRHKKNGKVYHQNGLICVDTFAHGGGYLTAIEVSQMRIYQVDLNGNVQQFDLTKL